MLFAPGADEIYPDGFATQIRIRGALTETLEGAHRGPGHSTASRRSSRSC